MSTISNVSFFHGVRKTPLKTNYSYLLVKLMELTSSTKWSKFFHDDPSGLVAISTILLSSSIFFLITWPLVSSINNRITLSISSRPTRADDSEKFASSEVLGTDSAMSKTSTHSVRFSMWSPQSGHPIMGTPMAILSVIEFHPQCVRCPPTAGFARICNWGAQDV